MKLLFGLMLIGSLFIFLGWLTCAVQERECWSRWNAALVMAIGIDVHAVGFALTLYGRLEQIFVDGRSFATEDPAYYLGAVLIIAGKTAFVWVAALGEGEEYSKTFWWSYVGAMLAWPVIVWSL